MQFADLIALLLHLTKRNPLYPSHQDHDACATILMLIYNFDMFEH
jgi:hypothetical protein